MNKYVYSGFVSEIEKIAGKASLLNKIKGLFKKAPRSSKWKQHMPWAISRGVTGAGSTLAIGLVMDSLLNPEKRPKNFKEFKERTKKMLPVAGVGAITGLTKGFSEKAVEDTVKKLLKVR